MALDIINCDDFFDRELELTPTEPLSYNFEKIGYESLYSIRNFGSLSFAFLIIPGIILIANFIGLFNCRPCKTARDKVNKAYFWNGIIGFINENFILICICWMLNLKHFGWNGSG